MTRPILPASALILTVLLPGLAQACATCGCSLSSDAATGYSSGPGWRVDLQYSYIDQSQLRSGTNSLSTGQVAAINNNGGNQEVEHKTTNQYATLGIAYSPDMEWNFGVQLPYVVRDHSTYSNATTSQLTPDNLSSGSFGDLGDVRLLASYQGLLPSNALGLQVGVKLPTGRYGGQNTLTGQTVGRSPVFFSSGPNASSGQTLDSSLQPGTGSTDVILGAYYYQPVSEDFDAFVNGRYQVAVSQLLDGVNANYRPGNTANVSFGVRYEHSPTWVPQLQINISRKDADQGALADTTDSAGTVIYASPGVTVRLDEGLSIYGFLQVPVHSWLAGYQLFPRWTANAGISYAF
jgi:hypothetical protein